MKVLAITLALIATAAAATVPEKGVQLPSYFQTCQRDQPELNTCLASALQNLVPYLAKGIPEFDLPQFEPFQVKEYLFSYENGHIDGKVIFRDMIMHGFKDMQVLAFRPNFDDLNNVKLEIDVFFPRATFEASYKLQGTFLTSRFGGRGQYRLGMSNVTTTWLITAGVEEADGVNYLKVRHFDMDADVGDMKVYFTNLFEGNEALSKSVVKLFNQYWRIIFKEVFPYVRERSDRIMREVANQVFLKVPFEVLFPTSS